MVGMSDGERVGLRERKKARTRFLIQSHALRLFHEQGYRETSVEEIAAAAEFSPSTVFHYFPTKADLVIYDGMDDRLVEALRRQSPDLSMIQALRGAIRGVFGDLLREEMALQRERERLIRTVPELSAAMFEGMARTLRLTTELLAERAGRPVDDEAVAALAGAVIGIGIASWFFGEGDDPSDSFPERFDRAMELLESGFGL